MEHKIKVSITLTSGTTWHECFIHLNEQRLSDIMNDEREFLPITRADVNKEKMVIVNKKMISTVTEA